MLLQVGSCQQIRALAFRPNSMVATNGSLLMCLPSFLADRLASASPGSHMIKGISRSLTLATLASCIPKSLQILTSPTQCQLLNLTWSHSASIRPTRACQLTCILVDNPIRPAIYFWQPTARSQQLHVAAQQTYQKLHPERVPCKSMLCTSNA